MPTQDREGTGGVLAMLVRDHLYSYEDVSAITAAWYVLVIVFDDDPEPMMFGSGGEWVAE